MNGPGQRPRRAWALAAAVAVATVLPRALTATEALAARPARSVRPQEELAVPARARLLVLAPHPDDETLGAGGLIQAVQARGGQAWVVFATSGDGFSLAVRRYLDRPVPGPEDYLRLGRMRRREALDALSHLGVPPERVAFLGFPDGGLLSLWRTNWDRPYRSPFTGAAADPYAPLSAFPAPYTGRALDGSLDRLLATLQPDLIAAPALADYHPDHKALALFARRAVARARARGEGWAARTTYLEYVVHREQWRQRRERALAAALGIPDEERQAGEWVALPLTPAQERAKRLAVAAHRSQTAVMPGFLYSFTGAQELFRVLKDPRPGAGGRS